MNDKLLTAQAEPLWNTDKKIISLIAGIVLLLLSLIHI